MWVRTGAPVFSGTAASAALLAALVACAPAPPAPPVPPPAAPRVSNAYLVLLPEADGSVGQVTFKSQGAETTLAQANAATRLGGLAGNTFTVAPEKVAKDFAAALAASPISHKTWLLYFEAGGTRLVPSSLALLATVKAEVAGRSAPDMSIIGHTDTAGDAAVNERLGLERARLVAGLLAAAIDQKVPTRIESHGETNLLVKTPDNTAEPRNRRVEVTVR